MTREQLAKKALESIQEIIEKTDTPEYKMEVVKRILALHDTEVRRLEFNRKIELDKFVISSGLWLNQQSEVEGSQ